MDFIHKQTREEITFAQLKERYPLTCFPSDFESGGVADFEGYAPVHPTLPPEHDAATHKVVRLPAVERDGRWYQDWEVVALTLQEIEDARRALVPAKVTRRQARQALLLAGLLGNVQPAIDAIEDTTLRQLAQIEWDDSLEFERSRPLLIQLAHAIGLDDEGIDALFITAAQL